MPTPSLPKCYKKMFPFTLATTSYIYPDQIIPNVAKLAPFLDEIELVFFESEGENNFPEEEQLKVLMNISLQEEMRYNIHLPIDIFLGDKNEEVRSKGVSVIREMIERTSCLNPSVYTLHFEHRDENGREETDIENWRRIVIRSSKEILACGIQPQRVSIETLGYPFEWVEDIVKKFKFSICLDIGHILICGQDLGAYFEKYLPDTTIIHLHGFQKGTDHLGVDRLPESSLGLIFSYLRNYRGIISVEVFSIDDLRKSLMVLEEKWAKG